MKSFLVLLLTLMMILPSTGAVKGEPNLIDDLLTFSYENVSLMQFRDKDDYAIRSVYLIALPDDINGINELIVEEYNGYQEILLIEYEFADVGSIDLSMFVCVGIADGTFTILKTPFEIIGRAYDHTIFEALFKNFCKGAPERERSSYRSPRRCQSGQGSRQPPPKAAWS